MSTNATIIMRDGNKYKSIYCHFDGYIKGGVGQMLMEHYTTEDKVKQLIDLGNISYLQPSCDKPEGHSFETPVEGYTIAYGRDRGEKNQQARKYDTLKDIRRENYNYYYDDHQWYILYGEDDLAPLTLDDV